MVASFQYTDQYRNPLAAHACEVIFLKYCEMGRTIHYKILNLSTKLVHIYSIWVKDGCRDEVPGQSNESGDVLHITTVGRE